MGKKNRKKKRPKCGIGLPKVSICTPTYNRRRFIPFLIKCYRAQTYPSDRLEWIVVDDGTDPVGDLFEGVEGVKYFYQEDKMKLGRKRNFMHEKTSGDIIIYMDDDDYYPPQRVAHAVTKLNANKEALACGSSEIYIYFKDRGTIFGFGPYGPRHATAGTFGFRKELLAQTKYDDDAEMAEEKQFLKNYTIPFVQLDPRKSILVFAHEFNTFDKRKLLENPHPDYVHPTKFKPGDFIKDKKMLRFYTSQ
jgi:glycosyltransferase involved in cell wall biosynthesis